MMENERRVQGVEVDGCRQQKWKAVWHQIIHYPFVRERVSISSNFIQTEDVKHTQNFDTAPGSTDKPLGLEIRSSDSGNTAQNR